MPLDINAIKRGFNRHGYSELNLIGGGASAQVLSVRKHNMKLALKCIALPEMHFEWNNEKEILGELEHPNVITLHGITQFDSLGVLEMELLARDLMSVIEIQRVPSGEHLKLLISQVCSAIGYCHEQGVAHMDIKPENLLVDDDITVVKLTDFGSALRFNPGRIARPKKKMGTFFYSAPEIINGVDFYPDKADIWSLGILLYTLHTHTWPYLNSKPLRAQIADGKVQILGITEPRLKELIYSMLQFDPLDRPSIEEILSHPWFNRASTEINSTSDTPEGRKTSRPRLVIESPRNTLGSGSFNSSHMPGESCKDRDIPAPPTDHDDHPKSCKKSKSLARVAKIYKRVRKLV